MEYGVKKMFGKKKGQATIEYLVLLAVAIIIALVIFAFMGWIPGFAGSLKERQVKLYWASQFPIQIRDYKVTTSQLTVQLQNVGDSKLNIVSFSANGVSNSSSSPTDTTLLAGESKVFTFDGISCNQAGQPYELSNVTIYYDVIGGITNQTERGDRPLVGTCQ